VVVGSRHCEGAVLRVEQTPLRRAGGRAFQFLARGFAGGVRDTQCGFKFFQHGAAQQIFSDVSIGGFAFDLEVLARARTLGLEVMEFPVEWTDRPGSTLRPLRDGLDTALELWLLKRRLREASQFDAA
jgi:dolichyl-phosphate beta-glucosyltransferase